MRNVDVVIDPFNLPLHFRYQRVARLAAWKSLPVSAAAAEVDVAVLLFDVSNDYPGATVSAV